MPQKPSEAPDPISLAAAARIRAYIESAGILQKDFGESCGVHPTMLSRLMRGTVTSIDTLRRIADRLGVPISDLIAPLEDRPEVISPGWWSVPFTGEAPCGKPAPVPSGGGVFPSVRVLAVNGLAGPDDLFAVQAVGDSMTEAGILDGDVLVIRQNENPPFGPAVMAIMMDGSATIKKRVHSSEWGGQACLQSCDGKKTVTLEFGSVAGYAGDVVAVHRGISVPDLPKRKRRSGK